MSYKGLDVGFFRIRFSNSGKQRVFRQSYGYTVSSVLAKVSSCKSDNVISLMLNPHLILLDLLSLRMHFKISRQSKVLPQPSFIVLVTQPNPHVQTLRKFWPVSPD